MNEEDRFRKCRGGLNEGVKEGREGAAWPRLRKENGSTHVGLVSGKLLRCPGSVILHFGDVVIAAHQVDANEEHPILHERKLLGPTGLLHRGRRATEERFEAHE